MRKKLLTLICTFLVCIVLARLRTVNAAQSTVAVYPPSKTVNNPGELFTLNLTITNCPTITQYIIQNLTWNPDIMELATNSSDDFQQGPGYFMAAGIFLVAPAEAGRVAEITNALLFETTSGSGALCTITFRAKAVGTATIQIFQCILLNGLNLVETSDLSGGTVTVVPEFPASLLLPFFLTVTAIAFIAKTILSRKRRDIKIP